MELVNGRPENTEGRLEKEIRVYDFLDSLGINYQRIDHEAAMTMEACERSTGRSVKEKRTVWRSVRTCSCATVRRQSFIFF